MALLKLAKRKAIFKALGYGEYNKESIAQLQKKYLRSKDVDGEYGVNTDNLLRHLYNVHSYTKDFKADEFKCGCGGKYCTGYPTYMKAAQLDAMQKIRTKYGKPMTITCGLRCSGYNKSLSGSVSNSRHLQGLACDYYIQGATDTAENRIMLFSFLKSIPQHRYSYGNGYATDGTYPHAPNMGNAVHTDTNNVKVDKITKEPKKPFTKAEKLAQKAEELAWPKGTAEKKWCYATGSPTLVCKTAMKARGYDTKIEFSDCGNFMNTCIYHALTRKVRVIKGVKEPFEAVNGFKIVYSGKSIKKSQLKRGDIIRYKNETSQHTLMYLGDGLIAEAGRGKRFGVIKKSTKYEGTKRKIQILRAEE